LIQFGAPSIGTREDLEDAVGVLRPLQMRGKRGLAPDPAIEEVEVAVDKVGVGWCLVPYHTSSCLFLRMLEAGEGVLGRAVEDAPHAEPIVPPQVLRGSCPVEELKPEAVSRLVVGLLRGV